MNLLKSQLINPVFRFIYKVWHTIDKVFRKHILQRIRYAGTAKLSINDIYFKMFSKCDDGIVDALYFNRNGYSEITEVKLFKELANNSKVILDIGANTGLYSIISRKTNSSASIYAFEPYIINLNRLKKNLLLNDIKDISIIEKALGDKEGEIEFAVPENDQICDVLSADIEFSNKFYRKWINYKTVKVPQTTLDDFILKENISAIDLIKIDVENYETFVLKGALKTLSKHTPIILIEIFVDLDKVSFFEEFLQPLGYSCYAILKEGIVRTKSLVENPDCRNFILSKKRTPKRYYSFTNMSELINHIKY